MTDCYDRNTTIADAIAIQSKDGGWICPECWNYGGGVRCKANVFIAFTGAYMKDCWAFDDKPRNHKAALGEES